MPGFFTESARPVPIAAEADVVVCGGGPAGVAAALAAARREASVVLLEGQGCFGGAWTAGLQGWISDPAVGSGIMAGIVEELDVRGARGLRVADGGGFACDPEPMKLVIEELVAAAGVQAQLHTRVCAAALDAGGRLELVVSESPEGRQAWRGRCFIDATGGNEVALLAGCGAVPVPLSAENGRAMCLRALVAGVRAAEIAEFVGDGTPAPDERLRRELRRAGIDPAHRQPRLTWIRDDLHVLAVDQDSSSATLATWRGRAGVNLLVSALRSLGGPWRKLRLVATAERPAIRGGRGVRTRTSAAGLRLPCDVHGMLLAADCREGESAGVAAASCARAGLLPETFFTPGPVLAPAGVEPVAPRFRSGEKMPARPLCAPAGVEFAGK